MRINNILKLGTILTTTALLASCAAISTAIEHRDLDVQSKMSNTIFMPPVATNQKTIYVDLHNTSGKSGVDLRKPLETALDAKGYHILTSPGKAHYVLQVNIRQIGKLSQSAADSALTGGYGSALSGVALGVGVAAATGGDGQSMIAGGVLGGVGATVVDSLVTDTTYTLITDVQISLKLPKGENATTSTTSATQSGSATQTVIHVSGQSHSMQYRTRIMSVADKVNLSFDTAKPALLNELASSIANIF